VRVALGADVLRPEHDGALLTLGIGFTDVVKRASRTAAELDANDFAKWAPRLLQKLRRLAPRVACFHGLTAYRPFLALALGVDGRAPALGPQPEVIGATRLFVVPNPSPANAHFTLDDQAAWYDRLADFLDATERAAEGVNEAVGLCRPRATAAPCRRAAPSDHTARRSRSRRRARRRGA
jgi:TDG/mug DNA glycosylase family protein